MPLEGESDARGEFPVGPWLVLDVFLILTCCRLSRTRIHAPNGELFLSVDQDSINNQEYCILKKISFSVIFLLTTGCIFDYNPQGYSEDNSVWENGAQTFNQGVLK